MYKNRTRSSFIFALNMNELRMFKVSIMLIFDLEKSDNGHAQIEKCG